LISFGIIIIIIINTKGRGAKGKGKKGKKEEGKKNKKGKGCINEI
jgi:hypothetical protein